MYSLYISYGSFYTLTYLVEKYLKHEGQEKEVRVAKLREILNGVLDLFQFAGQNGDTMKEGVNDALFSDLEDSYQAHAAEAEGCDVLLTIDINHFSAFEGASALSVLTPQQFVDTYISK